MHGVGMVLSKFLDSSYVSSDVAGLYGGHSTVSGDFRGPFASDVNTKKFLSIRIKINTILVDFTDYILLSNILQDYIGFFL